MYNDIRLALEKEKQIKVWLRTKKIELVDKKNPNWEDLSKDLYLR